MSITTSDGEELDEQSVRTTYSDRFKNSAEYQCLTNGHAWPEEPLPGSDELVCRRCGAIIELEAEGGEE